MTIRYKNQGFKQASTGKTTALTCPSDATIIVKSVYCANNDAKSQVNATPQGLNLEAGDSITVTAATGSNKIQGAISYALVDRSQENG